MDTAAHQLAMSVAGSGEDGVRVDAFARSRKDDERILKMFESAFKRLDNANARVRLIMNSVRALFHLLHDITGRGQTL
jgi:hypothetical protein